MHTTQDDIKTTPLELVNRQIQNLKRNIRQTQRELTDKMQAFEKSVNEKRADLEAGIAKAADAVADGGPEADGREVDAWYVPYSGMQLADQAGRIDNLSGKLSAMRQDLIRLYDLRKAIEEAS